MTQPPPYDASIPQPGDSIAEGQVDFLVNFSELGKAFANDHVALDASSNAGNHNVARLVEQGNPLATGAGDLAFYSKLVKNQTDELFLRIQGNGPEIQYSNYQIFPIPDRKNGNDVIQHSEFSFLPGNLIVYFGFVIPNSEPFDLILEPAICTGIISINLGVIGNNPARFPANVTLAANPQGIFDKVILKGSFTVDPPFIPQSYIIMGTP